MLLTTIARSEGHLRNLILIYHCLVCFLFFYGAHTDTNLKKIKLEIEIILKFFIHISTFLSLIGILIAINCGKYEINLNSYMVKYLEIAKNLTGLSLNTKTITLGIREHRLTGVYLNSNFLGIISVLSIISSFLFISKNCEIFSKKKISNRSKIPNWIFIFCIILNFLSLLLSDSLASIVFLVIYMLSLSFCSLINSKETEHISKFRLIVLGTFFLVVTLAILITKNYLQKGFNFLAYALQKISRGNIFPIEEIGRQAAYDITSNRALMFKQGLLLFFRFPFFGTSRANIELYSQRFLPKKIAYDDLHNGYLTVLVSWGIMGFVIFVCFVLLISFSLVKTLFKVKSNKEFVDYKNLFSLIVAYSIYSSVEITMISGLTFSCSFFWIILGWTMCYTNCKNKHVSFVVESS
jgi:O-antigen ligase